MHADAGNHREQLKWRLHIHDILLWTTVWLSRCALTRAMDLKQSWFGWFSETLVCWAAVQQFNSTSRTPALFQKKPVVSTRLVYEQHWRCWRSGIVDGPSMPLYRSKFRWRGSFRVMTSTKSDFGDGRGEVPKMVIYNITMGKSPLIVNLPIWKMVIFHSYVINYQMVCQICGTGTAVGTGPFLAARLLIESTPGPSTAPCRRRSTILVWDPWTGSPLLNSRLTILFIFFDQWQLAWATLGPISV